MLELERAMAEKMTPLDRVFDVLFYKWWGALLAGLALLALAYLIWPGRPANPDNARAFKGNVQAAFLSMTAAVCGLGMLVVAGYNLFSKGEDGTAPPKDGD